MVCRADRASDPTAGRAIDAATASRTNRAARKTASPLYPACGRMSWLGLRACVVGPGVRRADLPGQSPAHALTVDPLPIGTDRDGCYTRQLQAWGAGS